LIVSVLAGSATLALVWLRRFEPARYTAAVAVAAIVAGWALAQSPEILPGLTVDEAAASHDTLVAVIVAVIGGGLLLAVVVLYARRERLEEEGEETVEEELAAVVSDAIDDLRAEPDARRAVIAAYARMERVLAQHGQPRRRSEAPFEYLARVLRGLRVRDAAVRDLTELFERAKFSTHEIDEAMRERAIAALVSLREDLEASAAVAAA
jgi:hypothetical protein